MDRTHEIIDELEALAATISNVSSVFIFYFQNKIVFRGHPLLYSGKPPPPTPIQTPLYDVHTR